MSLEFLTGLCKREVARRGSVVLLAVVFVTGSWSLMAEWRSPYYHDHSLTGKIYSLQKNDWVSAEHLHQHIRDSQFLLLGETHTNPDHHFGQAELIHQWLDSDQSSVIVMEMLSIEEWKFDRKRWSSLGELRKSVRATDGKWQWELYDPILKMAVQHKLPIQAANLTRQQRMQYARDNSCQVEQGGQIFRFCDTLNKAQTKAIGKLILDAHCGYLQAGQEQPLVQTQIAKDASFALSLYRAGKENKVVFIAGAVHVRKDIGVPRHLKRIGIHSLSIAFVPVNPEKVTPADYIDRKLGRPFDYIVFTPSDRNTDPCVEFAEQLKSLKKQN